MADARQHWQEALAIYAEIDVPEADDVRARLASIADPAGCRDQRVESPA